MDETASQTHASTAIWTFQQSAGKTSLRHFQKKHLLTMVEAKVNTALADPQGPINIPKCVGKCEAEQPAPNPRPLTKPPPPLATPGVVPKTPPTPVPKPAPKLAPAWGAEGGGVSPAWLAMLNAARDA